MERPKVCLGLLGGYFALQLFLRASVSSTAELDESEQILLSQLWSWGYGGQPPLYTWLQILFFKGFGINVFSLALLKDCSLAFTYVFTYLSGRLVTREHLGGLLSALSLLFISQIAWESQRDLTHSVLATTIAAATIYVVLRLIETKALRFYLLFGLCLGLGCLAKYNYVLLAASLLGGACSLPALRSVILNPRLLLSLAVAGILVAPHVSWILSRPSEALSAVAKMNPGQGAHYLQNVLEGAGELVVAVVVFLGPLLLVYGLVFRKDLKPCWLALREHGTPVLWRQMMVLLGVLLLGVLLFRVTNFRDRWFLPLLIGFPVFLTAGLHSVMKQGHRNRLILLAAIVAVVTLVLAPGRVLFAARLGGPNRLTAPFADLARQMEAGGLPHGDLICENRWIGGNLKLAFPERTVLAPDLPELNRLAFHPEVVVWNASKSPQPAPKLMEFVRTLRSARLSDPRVAVAPRYHCPSATLSLGWGILKDE